MNRVGRNNKYTFVWTDFPVKTCPSNNPIRLLDIQNATFSSYLVNFISQTNYSETVAKAKLHLNCNLFVE